MGRSDRPAPTDVAEQLQKILANPDFRPKLDEDFVLRHYDREDTVGAFIEHAHLFEWVLWLYRQGAIRPILVEEPVNPTSAQLSSWLERMFARDIILAGEWPMALRILELLTRSHVSFPSQHRNDVHFDGNTPRPVFLGDHYDLTQTWAIISGAAAGQPMRQRAILDMMENACIRLSDQCELLGRNNHHEAGLLSYGSIHCLCALCLALLLEISNALKTMPLDVCNLKGTRGWVTGLTSTVGKKNGFKFFEKVVECLHRNPSSRTYYARVKIGGKQFKRSMRTKDLPEAKRKFRD